MWEGRRVGAGGNGAMGRRAAGEDSDNGQYGIEEGEDSAEVAASVKELQRADPIGREQWGLYCDAHGGGIRDPTKHPVHFLQAFLNQYHAGTRLDTGTHGVNLADLVKEGQRKSAHWKQAWSLYCQHYGGGINDPAKHEYNFIIGYLDFLGQRGTMAFSPGVQATMQMGGMPMPGALPPRGPLAAGGPERQLKRPRGPPAMGGSLPLVQATYSPRPSTATVGGAPGGSTGDPAMDALVARVKAYQRSGEYQRQTWWDYCDERSAGIRDPARHDSTSLEAFLSMNDVP